MRTTAELRRAWAPPCKCDLTTLVLHSGAKISVAARTAEAFRALDGVMQAAGYAPRAADTGGYNCRKITGGTGHSLHAYGIAVDYNWNSNPFRADGKLITDMPSSMVAAIKAIRTGSGAPVFRWGGDFSRVKDAMHFEVVASPQELRSGIDWVGAKVQKPDPKRPGTWPVLQRGDRGPTVKELQQRLTGAACKCDPVDGVFGNGTETSVCTFQSSRSLDVDGVVGLQTWTALLTAQGPTSSDRSPVKTELRSPTKDEAKPKDAGTAKGGGGKAKPAPKVPATCKLRSKGKAVTQLQQRLNQLGFDCGAADGSFGAKTAAAVKAFQKRHKLEVDGVAGPKTWAALLAA